jgi:DNA-directed RNA polymerase subunit RPC12/RpoP
MKFEAAKCPNCGGELQLPRDKVSAKCLYCGSDIVVREAIQGAAVANVGNLLKLADAASSAGNYEEAYNYYTKVLEFDSTHPDA